MDKSHLLETEEHNSEETSFCLQPYIGDLPPTISEILIKDDAFVYHMGKMIEEITRMASSCLSVRIQCPLHSNPPPPQSSADSRQPHCQ